MFPKTKLRRRTRVEEKQNSLFPVGPAVECLEISPKKKKNAKIFSA